MRTFGFCSLLFIFVFVAMDTTGQQPVTSKPSYGNNPGAGGFADVGDVKLYFEVYGNGKPLVLLHGGVYGYIDEFEYFIEKLASRYQVICIATRGHGKSPAGKGPFSYEQRASDAYKLIRSLTHDSVTVLGFSDGGYTAFKLAALHPELVNKLVVIGAGEQVKARAQRFDYNREALLKTDSAFFTSRLALMPHPEEWSSVLTRLNDLYNNSTIGDETFSAIAAPALVMGGDRDPYVSVEQIVSAARAIKGSRISIIPGCAHVVFYCNFPAVWEAIAPFLNASGTSK